MHAERLAALKLPAAPPHECQPAGQQDGCQDRRGLMVEELHRHIRILGQNIPLVA
jgi:hypothetical protein